MGISKASGAWDGDLKSGKGTMTPAHADAIPFSLGSRFEGKQGSNPEEVIGAALSGCFSMALSLGLEKAGATPKTIRTTADVKLDKDGEGFNIQLNFMPLGAEGRFVGSDLSADAENVFESRDFAKLVERRRHARNDPAR